VPPAAASSGQESSHPSTDAGGDGRRALDGEHIPLLTKLVFCAPSVAMLPFVAMFSLYGNLTYENFGASLAMISLFTALARSFDVVSDPLMSYVTDTTWTKYGRRRPFMFVGCFAYSLTLWMLLNPPWGESMTISMWFGFMYILYFLTNTFTCIPYYALAPELSRDSSERTGLFFMMSVFEGVGTLLAMAAPMAATLQARARNWNHWVCKPLEEQSSRCLSGQSCGRVPQEGKAGAFQVDADLVEQLLPLGATTWLDHWVGVDRVTVACSSWLEGHGSKVLGNSSGVVENTAFCDCMVDCDSACMLADERSGFMTIGYVFAIWFMITMVILVIVVKERPADKRAVTPPLVPAMLNTMMNGPFRVLLPAWACDAFCNAIVQCMTPYFVLVVTAPRYADGCERGSPAYNAWFCEPGNVIAACGISVLLAAVVGLPLWLLAVAKLGKVKTWWLWSLSMALSNVMFLFLDSGMVIGLWIVAALNGLPLGAKFLADSILSDIIDYDEFLTGQRNEATYFMFKGFLPKIVQIPASAIPIALMAPMGYIAPIGGVEQLQPGSVKVYIKVVVFTCFVVSVLAFMIKRQYPLRTDGHLRELQLGLSAHQQLQEYPDPVTKLPYRPPLVSDDHRPVYWMLDHFRARRIRRAFLPVSAQQYDPRDQSLQLEDAIELDAGAHRIVHTMNIQLAFHVVGFLVSVASTAGSMSLITHLTWQFVPTLTSIMVGIFIVGIVFSVLRKRAADQLLSCTAKGKLTPHIIQQVLLQRDVLVKVGVEKGTEPDKLNHAEKEEPGLTTKEEPRLTEMNDPDGMLSL